MGRRGGKKAAERWNDRNSEYAQSETQKLTRANKKRAAQGRSVSHRIAAYFDDRFFEVDQYPTIDEAAVEFGVSRRTVQRAVAKAGIELPVGRKKGDRP